MSRRDHFLLGLLGLVVILPVTIFQASPGYMDADYYMAGGISLAKGSGLNDFFLWNYLADPGGIPYPSHAYWMPLASLLSALGMIVTSVQNFSAARIPFLLVAATIAPITANLSFSIFRIREYAILAGIFAAIPGFYLAYLGTTDTFGIYMLLGGLWLLVVGYPRLNNYLRLFLLGLISGLLHLSRADGMIWLFMGIIFILAAKIEGESSRDIEKKVNLIPTISVLLGGYLLIMGPWMLRNLDVFGTLLSPGGLRALWLIQYDDLYAYPGDQITFSRWWASGITSILRSRWQALTINLQTGFAVQGGIFLAPLIVVGLWKARQQRTVRIGVLCWLLTLLMMTVIFPDVGWRGGFFHSGAATQPLYWAVAPMGLVEFVRLGVRVRNWNWRQAWFFFRTGSVIMLVLISVFSAGRRVASMSTSSNVWNQSAENYARIEAELEKIGAAESDVVLVNNPPGFFVMTGRRAISIPNGGVATSLAAADHYGGTYLILEINHPQGLDNLYNQAENHARLTLAGTLPDIYIYRITD